MNFELVEPVRILFKDEVRVVGDELGLPHGMVYRQPFPEPGLGVRCPGAITRDRLEAVRESDAILREEFERMDSKERSGSILLLFWISDLQESTVYFMISHQSRQEQWNSNNIHSIYITRKRSII